MSEDLTLVIKERPSGASLTWHYGSETGECLCLNQGLACIIDHLNQGYIDIDLKRVTGGKILLSFKYDGPDESLNPELGQASTGGSCGCI